MFFPHILFVPSWGSGFGAVPGTTSRVLRVLRALWFLTQLVKGAHLHTDLIS